MSFRWQISKGAISGIGNLSTVVIGQAMDPPTEAQFREWSGPELCEEYESFGRLSQVLPFANGETAPI